MNRLVIVIALLSILASACTSSARQSGTQPSEQASASSGQAFDERAVADFYRGRTIELDVGTGVGGGYDANARLVARHLGRFLPGSPSDWDAVFFHVGVLTMAGRLKPTKDLPKDAHLLGWGHLFE